MGISSLIWYAMVENVFKKSYLTEMIGPRHLHRAISRLCACTDQTYKNSGDRL